MKVAICSWEGLHFGVLSQLGSKQWKMSAWYTHPALNTAEGLEAKTHWERATAPAAAPNAVKSSPPTLDEWGKGGITDPVGFHSACAKSV